MELYEKIKARRLELGLTLEDVGNIVGVGKSTVRKWETGNIADMKRDKIALLSKALKVSPLFIMGIDEESPGPSITDKEKEILTKYNELDEKGKHTVNTVLDMEYNRCMDEKDYLKPVAAHNDNQNDGVQQQLIKNDLAKLRAMKKR